MGARRRSPRYRRSHLSLASRGGVLPISANFKEQVFGVRGRILGECVWPKNWKVLASLLPPGWQQMTWQSGAVERLRGFQSPDAQGTLD
jgi:hypothetical protein